MSEEVDTILKGHGSTIAAFENEAEEPRIRNGVVAGTQAIPIWNALREAFPRTGRWPLIRGEDKPEYEKFPIPSECTSVDEGHFQAVLQKRFEILGLIGVKARPTDPWDQLIRAVDAAGIYTFSGRVAKENPFPTKMTPERIPTYHTLRGAGDGELIESVWFSIVETRNFAEIPDLVGFYGGEACPPPQDLGKWLERWEKSHGAVPACVTRDCLEFFVERPPQNERDSLRLAFEQWLLCEDIVGQGTQSIRDLAIGLWRSPEWFFWWD